MNIKDYYQKLGIDQHASAEEIKRAYRKLAMQCHPDHNHGNEEWAHHQFKEINEAYSILGDPKKRKNYDNFGTIENLEDILGRETTRTTFEDLVDDLEGGFPDDDFSDDIFGDDPGFKGFRSWTFKQRFYGIRKKES